MNATNITRAGVVLLFVILAAISASNASALTVEISGNGSSANNSVQVTEKNQSVTSQNNNSNVTNDVNANANTGGNSVGPNSGNNNIKTGDSNVNVDICNNLNTNIVGSGGSINNPCATPTKKPNQPAPTNAPQGGVGGPGGGNGGSSTSSSSGGGVGGGSVAGLSTTSGENEIASLLKLLPAFSSLALGYGLLRKSKKIS